jgi:hypothetical protein
MGDSGMTPRAHHSSRRSCVTVWSPIGPGPTLPTNRRSLGRSSRSCASSRGPAPLRGLPLREAQRPERRPNSLFMQPCSARPLHALANDRGQRSPQVRTRAQKTTRPAGCRGRTAHVPPRRASGAPGSLANERPRGLMDGSLLSAVCAEADFVSYAASGLSSLRSSSSRSASAWCAARSTVDSTVASCRNASRFSAVRRARGSGVGTSTRRRAVAGRHRGGRRAACVPGARCRASWCG